MLYNYKRQRERKIPKTRKANNMKYLESKMAELCEGKKITYRGYIYWLNPVTREIYRHSVAAEISGVINGDKYANVTDDFKKIIKAE